jgi:hypothetical protein
MTNVLSLGVTPAPRRGDDLELRTLSQWRLQTGRIRQDEKWKGCEPGAVARRWQEERDHHDGAAACRRAMAEGTSFSISKKGVTDPVSEIIWVV